MAKQITPAKKQWADYTPAEKKQVIIGGLIFLAIIIVPAVWVIASNQSKSSNTPATSNTSETCIADLSGKSNEDRLKQIASDAAVNCDGMAKEVREVRVIPELDNTYSVNVTFFDDSFRYSTIKQTMGNIYYELLRSGIPLGTITVAAKNSYSNQYGNNADIIVLQTQVTNDATENINLNADKALIQMDIIPGLWTVQKAHGDIKEQMQL